MSGKGMIRYALYAESHLSAVTHTAVAVVSASAITKGVPSGILSEVLDSSLDFPVSASIPPNEESGFMRSALVKLIYFSPSYRNWSNDTRIGNVSLVRPLRLVMNWHDKNTLLALFSIARWISVGQLSLLYGESSRICSY